MASTSTYPTTRKRRWVAAAVWTGPEVLELQVPVAGGGLGLLERGLDLSPEELEGLLGRASAVDPGPQLSSG